MLNRNQSFKRYLLCYPPQPSIRLFSQTPSHLIDLSYPYIGIRGLDVTSIPFWQVDDKKKLKKNRHVGDRLLLLVAIRARWRQPAASVEALNLLYRAMRVVMYRRIAMARETASKLGTFFSVVLFAVTLAATGAIQSKYSSIGGIQWLLAKLWTYDICQCTRHYTGASAGLSKWVATEVFFCCIVDFDIIITVAYIHSNCEYKLKLICRRIHLYIIRLML
jgi:hypothetical protein